MVIGQEDSTAEKLFVKGAMGTEVENPTLSQSTREGWGTPVCYEI